MVSLVGFLLALLPLIMIAVGLGSLDILSVHSSDEMSVQREDSTESENIIDATSTQAQEASKLSHDITKDGDVFYHNTDELDYCLDRIVGEMFAELTVGVKTYNDVEVTGCTRSRLHFIHSEGAAAVPLHELASGFRREYNLPNDETLQTIYAEIADKRRRQVHELERKSVHARTWTDARGRTLEAEYISCHNGIVRLKNEAGKIHHVPMWNLSQPDQMFVVKNKGWAVIRAHRQANVKASLSVRLSERVAKEKLIAIANELHGFADNKQPRLFIGYYLPDMTNLNAGAWATSHFNPKLEIKILGTTKEEHALLQKEATTPTGDNVIGRWMDKTAFPGVITFIRRDGKIFKTKIYRDGSKGENEMVIRKVGSQTRYVEKNSKTQVLQLRDFSDVI